MCFSVCVLVYFYLSGWFLGVLIKIHQNGLQWKQGVVNYPMLYTMLLYHTTPIHCTPLPLHPPVMNTQLSPWFLGTSTLVPRRIGTLVRWHVPFPPRPPRSTSGGRHVRTPDTGVISFIIIIIIIITQHDNSLIILFCCLLLHSLEVWRAFGRGGLRAPKVAAMAMAPGRSVVVLDYSELVAGAVKYPKCYTIHILTYMCIYIYIYIYT